MSKIFSETINTEYMKEKLNSIQFSVVEKCETRDPSNSLIYVNKQRLERTIY